MSKIYDLAVAKLGQVVDFDGMYGGNVQTFLHMLFIGLQGHVLQAMRLKLKE